MAGSDIDRASSKDNTIVPFGKYKGQPVEDMLADHDYMSWLQAQPWFVEKFSGLMTAKERDASSKTPVHNRLQGLFLDPVYQMAFATTAAQDLMHQHVEDYASHHDEELKLLAEKRADHMRELEQFGQSTSPWEVRNLERARSGLARVDEAESAFHSQRACWTTEVQFEVRGADVVIRMAYDRSQVDMRYRRAVLEIALEIKPSVGDDYPVVLRQMKRNKSKYLFIGTYDGIGVTEDQFVAIFKASGKAVVFKRDVDAAR